MSGNSDFDGGAPAAFTGGEFLYTPEDSFLLSTIIRWSRCVLPVTVKQIHDLANNDQLMFITDGVEVDNVTIVGRVCQKEDKAGDYTLLVDDGTGQIECTKLVQVSIDADEFAAIPIGTYVCIHGQLRGQHGRRFINIFCIRPVIDSNEIQSLYQVYICPFLQYQRGLATQPHSGMNNNSMGYQAAPPSQFMDHLSKHFITDGISNIGQLMLNLFLQPAYLAIFEHLNIPMNGLMEDLQSLLDNGFVNSEIDDDHCQSTVNG